jgi:hypothetical protein
MTTATKSIPPPAAPPRQRTKPLLPVRGVCSLVDKNEDRVLELIENGSLAWAFDVSCVRKRRELRILPAAVAAYLHGRACELKWPDVLGLMLPDATTILASEITRILNVSCDHVYHLIDRKHIVACPTRRRGPGGSARVPTENFTLFLQQRRFP